MPNEHFCPLGPSLNSKVFIETRQRVFTNNLFCSETHAVRLYIISLQGDEIIFEVRLKLWNSELDNLPRSSEQGYLISVFGVILIFKLPKLFQYNHLSYELRCSRLQSIEINSACEVSGIKFNGVFPGTLLFIYQGGNFTACNIVYLQ